MEKKSPPLSIKLIYWFTQIGFWLYMVVGSAMIIACLAAILGFTPETLNLHIQAPFQFSLNETGTLELGDETYEAGLTEATGKINIVNTPPDLVRRLAFAILIVIVAFFGGIWVFRKFVINVFKGRYFVSENIKYLKHLAYWILAIYIASEVYFAIMAIYIAPKLSFDSISIGGDFDLNDGVLFTALIVWVMTHIFQKGIELQEQQKLTI